MISRFLAVAAIALLMSPRANAQEAKTTTNQQQVWLGYFNQTRFSNKWGLWADIQLRTKDDFVNDLSVSLNRFGLTYYVTDNTKLTAGYAYVHFYPADNHPNTYQPEHRPWQQVQWNTTYGKKKMMQWIRLDERFRRKIVNGSTLGDGYNFNFKIRYNIFYDIPLSPKGIVPGATSFVMNNEVHINFGKEIVYNYFDQNRLYFGLKYQVNKHDNLQAGYMYLFQQLGAGNRYRNIHAARIFYFHNLDLRKKK